MEKLIVIIAVFNALFLLIVVIGRWQKLSGSGRKFTSMIALGVFPLVWGVFAFSYNMERFKEVDFCARCHVMEPYALSLEIDDDESLPAIHYQNNWTPKKKACYSCHTRYTMFGELTGKLVGLKHMYVYYLGKPPKKLELYDEYKNSDCLFCHGSSRRFFEGLTHTSSNGLLEKIVSGKISCLTAGCHDIGHVLEEV